MVLVGSTHYLFANDKVALRMTQLKPMPLMADY